MNCFYFMYTAWFRNGSLKPGDEDYEFPFSLAIEAPSMAEAEAIGEKISNEFLAENPDTEKFNTTMENIRGSGDCSMATIPFIHYEGNQGQ